MGFMDSIFGSSGKTQHSVLDNWDIRQKRIAKFGLAPFLDVSGRSGEDILGGIRAPEFEGSFGQGPTSEQLTSLAAMEAAALKGAENSGNLSAKVQEYLMGLLTDSDPTQTDINFDPNSAPRLDRSERALSQFLDVDPTDFDDFYKQTVSDPLMEQFKEEILPGISAQMAPNNFWSSQRVDQEQRAYEELIETLGRERARIGFETEEANKARAISAAQGIDQLEDGDIGRAFEAMLTEANLNFQGAEAAKDRALSGAQVSQQSANDTIQNLLAVISGGETVRQAQDDIDVRMYEDFLRQVDEPYKRAELMMRFLGLEPFENVITQKEGKKGILGDVAGAVAGTAAKAAFF